MKRTILLLLSLAGLQCFPVEAFASSLDVVLSSSRAKALPRTLVTSPTNPNTATSSLAFVKRDASSSQLSFSPTNSSGGKEEPWIRPAIHNSGVFRAFAILYALLFAIYQNSNAPSTAGANAMQKFGKYFILAPKAAATVHVLSFATWFGTVVYTTFIAGITMFKNLPRRTFGTLQSKLFPLYFQLCTGMIGLQILTLITMPDILSKTSELSLGIAFFSTLLNLLYLEPASTENMFGRYSLEDKGKKETDEYKKLAKSFGKFHGMSSLFNLVALCGGIVHGMALAWRLV